MKKLTITIPDDLHKRLQKVREHFNISKACRYAIKQQVVMQENLAPFYAWREKFWCSKKKGSM